MSRDKYTMTDASAKRITMVLQESFEPAMYMSIPLIEKALKDENFTGFTSNHLQSLSRYWQERVEAGDKKNFHAHMIAAVSVCYVREYYEQRQGIRDMKDGMMRLGFIPYPEEDDA